MAESLNVLFPVDAISKSGTVRPTSEVSISKAMFTETQAECNTSKLKIFTPQARRPQSKFGRNTL
jgi:hypothetical protein